MYCTISTKLQPHYRSNLNFKYHPTNSIGQHISTCLSYWAGNHFLCCMLGNKDTESAWVLTPNICLRSGSLNLKGMLETWSLLGCDLFSVFSDVCVCCWLSVCAESSVCCGKEKERAGKKDKTTVSATKKISWANQRTQQNKALAFRLLWLYWGKPHVQGMAGSVTLL